MKTRLAKEAAAPMLLKQVTIEGFKSFADRTAFDFAPGVTGIVGPNGCGKSNVVDAIRWVLGEQSARSLRGSRMFDVIFAGAAGRPPANSAEVQLTFDNSDGFLEGAEAEVTVTRLLYRDGDSEYQLNGKTCRLKDIRELLLDTGVAVNAYSIIEQGRVDALLQANPQERRAIFEEAAGISRYRVRRAEAQRKLDRTEQNLLRLNDVLDELERRLRSVKLAAGKARNFKELDAKLRSLRSSFVLAEYHQQEQSRLEISAASQALEQTVVHERAALNQLEQDIAYQEANVAALDEELHDVEATLANERQQRATLEERREQSRRRQVEMTDLRDKRHADAQALEQRKLDLEQQLSQLHDELARQQAHLVEVEREHVSAQELKAQAVAAISSARHAVEEVRSTHTEAAQQLARLENEQRSIGDQRDRAVHARDGAAERVETLTAQLATLEADHEAVERRQHELQAVVDDAAQQLEACTQRLESLTSERRAAAERVNQCREDQARIQARIATLEDVERRREGIDAAARTVLAWQSTESSLGEGATTDPAGTDLGVIGVLADLIEVSEPRASCLATFFAAIESRVVVRTAEPFVTRARDAGLPGPLRFYALDQVTPPLVDPAALPLEGFIAKAADWVSGAPEIAPLMQQVLGRVWIFRSQEQLRYARPHAPADVTLVSLDGVSLSGSGEMTLPSSVGAPGLISLRAEVRQLRDELAEIEGALQRESRARAELDAAFDDAELQQRAAREALGNAQQSRERGKFDLSRVSDSIARVAEDRGVALTQRDEHTQRFAVLAEQLATQEQQCEHAAVALQELARDLDARSTALEAGEAAVEEASHALTVAHVAVERERERFAANQQRIEQEEAALEHQHATLVAAQQEAQAATDAIATVEHEVLVTAGEIDVLDIRIAHLTRERDDVTTQRTTARTAVASSQQSLDSTRQSLEHAAAALQQRESDHRAVVVRQEGLVQRVREDFDEDLEQLYVDYDHIDQDWDAVRDEIEDIRGRITRLGNVNLGALDELEELTPRYEEMQQQQLDLRQSIDSLHVVIADLDAESEKRFIATFADVREHFQALFRKLFGGGKADIVLEDESQPLECGIDIIARPPGKEPQSVALLSGGERTMTAVAVLLAIFQSRPSPFAIMDEVDAALDESNVGRFGAVLQDFLTQSQFVIITHNKRTMLLADRLYGVTMEQSGVSKRVSVRFEDRVESSPAA